MAKLTRVLQKIFGESASVDEVGKFGSLAAGLPETTTDPTVMQSLANWGSGWFSAVVGSNSPAIEDRNAVDYVTTYQLAYLFQHGVPEYQVGTEYHIGSVINSAGVLYISKTDTNTGNAVGNIAYWKKLTGTDSVKAAIKSWEGQWATVTDIGNPISTDKASTKIADVYFGSNKFVMAVAQSKFYTNVFGTWSAGTAFPTITKACSIAYSPVTEMAVVSSFGASGAYTMAYTTTGSAFTEVGPTYGDDFYSRQIAYGNGHFISAGNYNIAFTQTPRVTILDELSLATVSHVTITDDGSNTIDPYNIHYIDNSTRFVVTGYFTAGPISGHVTSCYSDDDGATWTYADYSSMTRGNYSKSSSAYGNGIIVQITKLAGSNDSVLISYDDGLTYDDVTSSGNYNDFNNGSKIKFCNGFFMTYRDDEGARGAISEDGITWELVTYINDGIGGWTDMEYSETMKRNIGLVYNGYYQSAAH